MPIHTRWFDEAHTIAYYEFEERWTWDDLYAAVKTVLGMIANAPRRVDVIFDVTRSIGMPSGSVVHMRGLTANPPANFGIGVMVGANMFVKTMVQIFLKLYPQHKDQYYITETVDQALAVIASQRAASADRTSEGQKP